MHFITQPMIERLAAHIADGYFMARNHIESGHFWRPAPYLATHQNNSTKKIAIFYHFDYLWSDSDDSAKSIGLQFVHAIGFAGTRLCIEPVYRVTAYEFGILRIISPFIAQTIALLSHSFHILLCFGNRNRAGFSTKSINGAFHFPF